MPVSDEARQAVIKASGGLCELFHEYPVEGNQIVHSTHRGMGGASKDAECNDPDVLLWGCQACHDLADGRSKHAPCKIVRFSRSKRVFDIMGHSDEGGYRPIPHEKIFFHLKPEWDAKLAAYPLLVDAIRRQNEAAFDVAKNLSPFRPSKKGPEWFRVCPEIKQMGDKATFFTFLAQMGMTAAKANERMVVGDWLNEDDRGFMRGIDMDVIDALRQASDEECERLLGLAAKPREFWAAVDKLTEDKHGRRSHYMTHEPKTGKLKDLGLLAVPPDVADAFNLIKGRTIKGAKEEQA